jgi:hypothetical protein
VNKKMNRTTIAIVIMASTMVIVGTNVAPLLQQQAYAGGHRHDSNVSADRSIANAKNVKDKQDRRSQHLNQENICYRSDHCNNSNVAQQVSGNDNSLTGFADQSANNTPTGNLTAGVTEGAGIR